MAGAMAYLRDVQERHRGRGGSSCGFVPRIGVFFVGDATQVSLTQVVQTSICPFGGQLITRPCLQLRASTSMTNNHGVYDTSTNWFVFFFSPLFCSSVAAVFFCFCFFFRVLFDFFMYRFSFFRLSFLFSTLFLFCFDFSLIIFPIFFSSIFVVGRFFMYVVCKIRTRLFLDLILLKTQKTHQAPCCR